jgi:hypothetical protein
MARKIDRDSLNWQAGYHQGLIDRMNDFVEAEEEMLKRARWLREMGAELARRQQSPGPQDPKEKHAE